MTAPLPANSVNGAVVLQDNSVPHSKLINAGYEVIGKTTLGVAGDTITVSGLPARKHLLIVFSVFDTGGAITVRAQFNGDTGNNYAARGAVNGAADFNVTSQSSMLWDNGGSTASPHFGAIDVINVSAQEKLCVGMVTLRGTAGAANNVSRVEVASKWANTSSQISSVSITNVGVGDYAVGSEMRVLALRD
ncbi:hypothetical protein [Mycolicibacterium porcinum]|uniref:hypothetical protein n=1 Tax=Mycolicibacterium porcinum TaxID=39693 RepID=UPI0010427B13|nr:hypothetical protein [Mycolicibacterium porcinum]